MHAQKGKLEREHKVPDDSMIESNHEDQLIQESFELIYTLHADRAVSSIITFKGHAAYLANKKTKFDVLQPNNKISKFLLTGEKLLQCCLYAESEKWELDQEQWTRKIDGNYYLPTLNDLLVRYIKLICYRTFTKIPRHLAVGIGCHLYQYRPEHISDLLPEVCKEDNVRRDSGARLREITERFPNLETVVVDQYQTKKVKTNPPTFEQRNLVIETLATFYPRSTLHKKPLESALNAFVPINQEELDWKQKHLLTCTACAGFEMLARKKWGGEMLPGDPHEKLEIPEFSGHNSKDPSSDRFCPEPLSPEAIALIKEGLKNSQKRRKQHQASSLRIDINGKPCVELLPGTSSTLLIMPDMTSFIEIFADDYNGEFLLTAFFLPDLESMDEAHLDLDVTTESGQTLRFIVEPIQKEDREIPELSMLIVYEKLVAMPKAGSDVLLSIDQSFSDQSDSIEELIAAAALLTTPDMQTIETTYGLDHPELPKILNSLGCKLQKMGRLDEAQRTFERALHIIETVKDSENHEVATILNNLGDLLLDLYQIDDSVHLFEHAVKISDIYSESKNIKTSLYITNLGNALMENGQYEKAHTLFKKSYDINIKDFGENSCEVAKDINNIGSVFRKQKNFDKAKKMFLSSIDIYKSTSGENKLHEEAIVSSNLGCIYYDEGNFVDAEDMFKKALEIDKCFLSIKHRGIAFDLNNLGLAQLARGKRPQAQKTLQQSWEIFHDLYGASHPYTIATLESLRAVWKKAKSRKLIG